MTAIGSGFKGPSLYELRGNLLKMAVNEVQDYLQQIKKVWNETGCTLMADEIGAENDASYKTAGKKLQQKYGSFYWFPCAAHCSATHYIDLMLENFSNPIYFPLIDDTIRKAKKITKFIYNHGWVLALMRQDFTKGHDLCQPAMTSHSKSNIGKEIAVIVLEDKEFWAHCQFIVKVGEPLVRVLRLIDGNETPAMRYLYDAMEKAKENIKARYNNKVSGFNLFAKIIDSRWDKQLHNSLHAAGCVLNSEIYYSPSFKNKNNVARGFNGCVMKMELDLDDQDKIIRERLV
ncbi:uncharacterized protein LOC122274623 [Carya illinoinensis]|uniref:uncharacterized protein LOC122274623 n=1 Tax=Carya illinoinensis TaxID=32201 RepID=UPI001C71E09E|nr:uncharacterized protein LOC122274623 [Carya illinoinensis]